MRITKKELKEVEITEDIICNKCGNSCKPHPDIPNHEGIIEYEMTGGYGSLLGDMLSFKFSICEKCMGSILKTFIINPIDEDNCNFFFEKDSESYKNCNELKEEFQKLHLEYSKLTYPYLDEEGFDLKEFTDREKEEIEKLSHKMDEISAQLGKIKTQEYSNFWEKYKKNL